MGLEPYADRLLYGEAPQVTLLPLVDANNPNLETTEKVLTCISHIISQNMSKHSDVLEELRRL